MPEEAFASESAEGRTHSFLANDPSAPPRSSASPSFTDTGKIPPISDEAKGALAFEHDDTMISPPPAFSPDQRGALKGYDLASFEKDTHNGTTTPSATYHSDPTTQDTTDHTSPQDEQDHTIFHPLPSHTVKIDREPRTRKPRHTPSDTQLPDPHSDTNSHSDNTSQPHHDTYIGTVIDERYQVLSVIALGGMSTVYKALDERLDRHVALKIMHPHLAQSPDLVQRFRREARAVARLSHPGIVGVYDQGVINGAGYLVMEYVHGPNLREVLHERTTFTVGDAFDLIEEVLQALAVAHKAGLIHRDVKPENVLIAPNGQAKVADFGLARVISDATASSTGSVLGTVAYLAPELISAEEIDARTDVYSIGIMLYELLAGKPPYAQQTPIQIAWAHVNEDVPLLHKQVEWIPAEVSELICDLTSRDPDPRPADAAIALDYVQSVRLHLSEDVLTRRAKVSPMKTSRKATVGDTTRTAPLTTTHPTASANNTAPLTSATTQVFDYGHGTAALPMIVEGDDKPETPQEKRRKIIVGISILLSLLLIAAGVAWYFFIGPGAYETVPRITELSEQRAVEVLKKHGFHPHLTYDYSDTVPQGTVISSLPKQGESVKKQSTIKLVISRGVHFVSVPSVVGMTQDKARHAIEEAQLSVGKITEEYSETVEKDIVLLTNPQPGESIKHDSPVDLVISKGRQPIEVPDITGKSTQEASKIIEDAGLTSQGTPAFSDSVERHHVISQDPQAGSNLYKGDTVNYVFSQGPEMVEVPQLIGKPMEEAKNKLSSLGFHVEVQSRSPGIVPNVVFDQSVAGGQKVKSGSTIILYHY